MITKNQYVILICISAVLVASMIFMPKVAGPVPIFILIVPALMAFEDIDRRLQRRKVRTTEKH